LTSMAGKKVAEKEKAACNLVMKQKPQSSQRSAPAGPIQWNLGQRECSKFAPFIRSGKPGPNGRVPQAPLPESRKKGGGVHRSDHGCPRNGAGRGGKSTSLPPPWKGRKGQGCP